MSEHRVPGIKRVRTPTVIQMESVECGAASLAIILEYHGRYVPLEELRVACDVNRDGSNALRIIETGRAYGLEARGFKSSLEGLAQLKPPFIIYWKFNHFAVFEGADKDGVFLNDPGTGPRTVTHEEFDRYFTGVVLTFEKKEKFPESLGKPGLVQLLVPRLRGAEEALIYVVLAGLALVVPGLVIPTFTKVFLDEILIKQMSFWLVPLLVGMGLTVILQGLLSWLRAWYLARIEVSMALAQSGKMLWHLFRLPIAFFHQRMAGDLSYRVGLNDRVATLLTGRLTTALLDLTTVVFFLFLMVLYDPVMTSIGLLTALLNLVYLYRVNRKRVDETHRLNQETGKLLGTGTNGLSLIETLKASGAESDFFSVWAGYHTKALEAEQKLGRLTYRVMSVPPLLAALNTTTILSLGCYRVWDGTMTLGMLVAFQALMTGFLKPVNSLVELATQLQNAHGDMNRLEDILRHEEAPFLTGECEDYHSGKLSGHLQLRNLTFGYARQKAPLIEDFSLELKPGRRVALTGKSGSGKSTLSKLVAGLYQPWSGDILLDGRTRGQIPREVINQSLAMVDQDIALFEGTVRENLTLWNEHVPERDMMRAARDAEIHDEITSRLGAYDSMVKEAGSNFSGGQRQRLEIARALCKEPSILVLDEATSALDPQTENLIDHHIRRRGCTCLIVAHRLSTIRDCDEIIVLESGKVVQRGTHEELIAEGGPYAELVEVSDG